MKILVDKHKTAIYYKNEAITYKDVIINVKKISTKTNIEKETNNMIFMENRPELLYTFFAIWNSKATCVCIDASSSVEELSYFLKNSESKKIFTTNMHIEKVKEATKLSKVEIEIINIDDIDFSEIEINIEDKDLYVEAPEKENTALILYTSGTTGKPKGVMLSFDNLLANMEALDEHKMYDENDVIIALLPLHHILPLLGTGILPLTNSATIVFLEDLSSTALIETMKKYKVTMLIGVPRLWEMMHKKIMDTINSKGITKFIFKLAKKINSFSFSKKIFKKVAEGFGGNIKFFVSGGSKLNEQIAADFYTLGIKVCEGYGMTETAPMICYTPKDDIVPGCAGVVIKGVEVKIASDGEILVKGRNVMKGYYKNSLATSEIIDKDGWLHTGDLGRLEAGNHLYVTGRKKEMIVLSNGKNINPLEIEEKIASLTNIISEIVVLENNSVLTAVINPDLIKVKENKIANVFEELKWNIIDKYNQKVADYKKILDVKIVNEEFPKTKIGKIRRFMIPDMLAGKLEKKVRKEEPTFDEYIKLKNYIVNAKAVDVFYDSHIEIDLGMDSLDIVEFLHFIEINFGVKEEDLISKNQTLLELASYIKENRSGEKIGNLNWNEIVNKDIDAKLPSSSFITIFMKWVAFIFFNTYLRIKVFNKEKLNVDKQCIFIGNHQSFLDAFMFNYAVSNKILRKTYFMAKVVHFKNPIMKFLGNMGNVILVDVNKDISEVMQTLAKVLKQKKNVLIFPEGLRTRDGKLNEFKKTFAILAKELNVELQPFVINGAYKAYPTGQKFPSMGKISIKFLDRINSADLSYEEIVEKSYNAIKTELEK